MKSPPKAEAGTGLSRFFWPAFSGPGLVWLVLFFLIPFYAVLSVAMGRLDPIFNSPIPVWNPFEWNPSAFSFVFQRLFSARGQFQVVFLRTFSYVAIAVTVSLLIGYPVAYYISRHGGRFKSALLTLLIAPFWIMYMMRMLAWVNLLRTDGYVNKVLVLLGILDAPRAWLEGEHITVILGLVYGYVPFLILPLYAALDRIDRSVLEAARDLGAGPLQSFLRVTLPLSRQGILAGCVIITLPMFGDYYTPDLLSGAPRTSMIGNQISFYFETTTSGATGAALVVVLSAVVSVLMVYYLWTITRAAREAR